MVSQKKALSKQKSSVLAFFDNFDEVKEELKELANDTEIAYLTEYADEAQEYLDNEGQYMGLHTGYPGLDTLMGSFLPGELLTIGGDTGHGKSLLAMNIAQNVYEREQKPVLMVNLELTRPQAYVRFHNMSKDGDFAGILIQRAPAVTYRDIDVLMKKAKEEGACLVVIDHLHFFSRSADNVTQELSRITKHFKECAVENELPVLLLSHVTPTRIMAPDGSVKKEYKPGLHNLKGSSAIEQDSDMVAFVYRKEGESGIEVYLKKNRSRPLNTSSTYLKQKGWKLEQDPLWLPQNSEHSGN